MFTRRQFGGGAGSIIAVYLAFGGQGLANASDWTGLLARDLTDLEAEINGRLGVAVLDTKTGMRAGHRADERFAMCSTFKMLAAAAVLKRADDGKDDLGRRVHFSTGDLVTYSPVTQQYADGEGMTMGELCAAAMTLSDNTAGNLLLSSIGGPPGLTEFARSLGDNVSRLDRREPDLNEAAPGDPRDTTSPGAMLGNLDALIVRQTLSARGREHLIGWLTGNKTGAGGNGTTNDIAVIWPSRPEPILVTAYLTQTSAPEEKRYAAIASVGRIIARRLGT